MPRAATPSDRQQPRIALVAARDGDTVARCTAILQPLRFLVEHAETGPDALAHALRDTPALLIVDAALPTIDGFALAQLLRADPQTQRLPLVMLVADADDATATKARGVGADAAIALHEIEAALPGTLTRLVPDPANGAGAASGWQGPEGDGLVAPLVRCSQCDAILVYERTYWGGIPKARERWDVFRCPRTCGRFEYRHRTRQLRAVSSA